MGNCYNIVVWVKVCFIFNGDLQNVLNINAHNLTIMFSGMI